MSDSVLELYVDDSGSRYPDHENGEVRRDGMNHFALGGVMVERECIPELIAAHRKFCALWKITGPLHSVQIRGRRGFFSWLAGDKQLEADFLGHLEEFILGLPIVAIAAVIDRPGYVARYKEHYGEKTWLMCKTAFSILVERAAKFARSRGNKLEVYFEQSGRREDRSIKEYSRALKKDGMPFDGERSGPYRALSAEDFRAIIFGEPRERTKKVPMLQIADLVLYPMAKGGYDATYRPYRALLEQGKLIDAMIDEKARPSEGIKYSCFDFQKRQDPAQAGS